MRRAAWIGMGAGILAIATGAGALWWLGSGKNQAEPIGRPEAQLGGDLGSKPTTAEGAQRPATGAGPTAEVLTPSAPTTPVRWEADSAPPRATGAPVAQLQSVAPNTFNITVEPLPAGAIKHERLGNVSVAPLGEPGLVLFNVTSGQVETWHWARSLAKNGATPVVGTAWAVVEPDWNETDSLLVSLSDGPSYRVRPGVPLWAGPEGALFRIKQGDRYGLLLTDPQFRPLKAAWLPKEYENSYEWRRVSDGTFRFRLYNPVGEYKVDLGTGAVSALQAAYQFQQSTYLASGCSDAGIHQVKVYQGEQVRYRVLDAVAPSTRDFRGSPILGDGTRLVVGTSDGPAILDMATGSLQGAPELRALGSPYLLAAPSSVPTVATIPQLQKDGTYRIQVSAIGRSGDPRAWTLKPGPAPTGAEVRIRSNSYWSADGTNLQVSVSYPDAGGRCGGADPVDTHLNPVVVKGDFKGALQVRIKAPVQAYAMASGKLGAPLRTVAAQSVLTVQRIELISAGRYALVVALPEGEGAIPVDRASLEWVVS